MPRVQAPSQLLMASFAFMIWTQVGVAAPWADRPARDFSYKDIFINTRSDGGPGLMTIDDEVFPNFPNIPRKNGGATGGNTAGTANNGGVVTTPGNGGVTPGNGGNKPANPPGSGGTAPTNPTTPATPGVVVMKAADVSAQFQCPMFSTSPLSDIQNSLNSLKTALSVISTPECNNETGAAVMARGQKLLTVVQEIEKMQGEWATDFNTPDKKPREIYEKRIQTLNAKMKTAIEDAEGIAAFLQSKILKNPKCIDQLSNPERIIFGVNDLIQGLSPLALQVAGSNPAFAPALPYVFGATLVSSGVSALAKMADETKKLDIKSEVNEKALIQNTCQFIKVYRTVSYLQLSKDRRIEDLDADFNKDRRLYDLQHYFQSSELQNILIKRRESLDAIRPFQDRFQENEEQLVSLEQELQADSSIAGLCALGKMATTGGMKIQNFPTQVINDLEAVVNMYGEDFTLSFQVTKLKDAQASLVQQMKRMREVVRYDERECAASAQRWFNELKRGLATTEMLLSRIQSRIEERALQNPIYKTYSYEAGRARNHELNKVRLQKILEEMDSNPQAAAVIERSRLTEKKNDIIRTLFSSDMFSFKADQPVKRWMMYKEDVFKDFRTKFQRQFALLVADQSYIAPRPLLMSNGKTPRTGYEMNAALIERSKDLAALKFLNFKLIKPGSSGHREVCPRLEVVLGLYNDAVDALGNIEYMCDMIRPVLYEPLVDRGLKNYCLDVQSFASEVYASARYKMLIKDLVRFRPQALAVKAKLAELECAKLAE